MTTTPPTLRDWHGANPPEIRTVGSLRRSITIDHYNRVYWIAKMVDNVVVELHPLKIWHFANDGRLIGEVDIGSGQKVVEINPDEYVVVSVE